MNTSYVHILVIEVQQKRYDLGEQCSGEIGRSNKCYAFCFCFTFLCDASRVYKLRVYPAYSLTESGRPYGRIVYPGSLSIATFAAFAAPSQPRTVALRASNLLLAVLKTRKPTLTKVMKPTIRLNFRDMTMTLHTLTTVSRYVLIRTAIRNRVKLVFFGSNEQHNYLTSLQILIPLYIHPYTLSCDLLLCCQTLNSCRYRTCRTRSGTVIYPEEARCRSPPNSLPTGRIAEDTPGRCQ
ncbi:unnamed protein product [Somion occarium]|uniref:Uncharacterized protein n=1 Tax=Somion occarium TaxID=3059160 RepID=A0ABP1CIL5_9APHY